MDTTASSLEPTAEEVVEIRAGIRHYLERMDQIHQQMVCDQVEIDQLKQETQEIAQETRRTLERLTTL